MIDLTRPYGRARVDGDWWAPDDECRRSLRLGARRHEGTRSPGGVANLALVVAVLPDVGLIAAGADQWRIGLAERWNVGRNQNGGVLLAAASAALSEVTGQPHPLTVTGHYLAPTAAGEATVRTALLKPGRTFAAAGAELWQDDRERLRVVGAFGDLSRRAQEGPSLLDGPPPPLPAPDACDDLFDILVAGPAGPKAMTRSLRNFEIRVGPDAGWGPDANGQPSLSGWLRFRDCETVTAPMLVAVADAFPPTVMSCHDVGWLPTIELTVHVFRLPAPDEPWLRAELRTRSVLGGLLDEDGELWDMTGRLVARFRQLALVIPRGHE